jgi:hypothetical protein
MRMETKSVEDAAQMCGSSRACVGVGDGKAAECGLGRARGRTTASSGVAVAAKYHFMWETVLGVETCWPSIKDTSTICLVLVCLRLCNDWPSARYCTHFIQ